MSGCVVQKKGAPLTIDEFPELLHDGPGDGINLKADFVPRALIQMSRVLFLPFSHSVHLFGVKLGELMRCVGHLGWAWLELLLVVGW
jgi:hypothetical protein